MLALVANRVMSAFDDPMWIDGHKVTVANAGVTKPGDVLRVVGEGMPLPADPHKRGDLHVLVTVGFPATLSDAQKAVVREHFRPAKDEL